MAQRTLTRAEQLTVAANHFSEVSAWIEKTADILDDGGSGCECCGSFRYRSFAQHILKQKVLGSAERLREIANTFSRRAADPEFEDGRGEEEKQ